MRRLVVVLALVAVATGCATHVSPPARSPSASASASRAPGLRVITRIRLPGCDDDHGLALDSPARLAFIACDVNSVLLTVDMTTWQVTGTANVGIQPDVLAFDGHAVAIDPATGRSYFPVLKASSGHPAVLVCELS